ncbi:hypothetical protein ABZ260_22020 [Streptosporangium sp. NPDC006013]|uniref:hypothetical protein n=1 Tax=Streptosporangium sp. NPDC006013 TaxID=3155596 RepID=UPI0033BA3E2F
MIHAKLKAFSAGERSTRRVVCAVLVGIILPVGLLTWSGLMANLFSDSSRCGHYTGCLGFLVEAWVIGRWVAIVLAWPLLYLLRVRPAWPVAILAACFLVVIWQVADALWAVGGFTVSLALIMFSGVIAYPLAALVTARRSTATVDGGDGERGVAGS